MVVAWCSILSEPASQTSPVSLLPLRRRSTQTMSGQRVAQTCSHSITMATAIKRIMTSSSSSIKPAKTVIIFSFSYNILVVFLQGVSIACCAEPYISYGRVVRLSDHLSVTGLQLANFADIRGGFLEKRRQTSLCGRKRRFFSGFAVYVFGSFRDKANIITYYSDPYWLSSEAKTDDLE